MLSSQPVPYARNECAVRTLISATIGRPTSNRLQGYWRGQMKSRLYLTRYGQRWQVETLNSMLKRLQGSALRARQYWSQCRETLLRAITRNVMILKRKRVFYGAFLTPILATTSSAIIPSTLRMKVEGSGISRFMA